MLIQAKTLLVGLLSTTLPLAVIAEPLVFGNELDCGSEIAQILPVTPNKLRLVTPQSLPVGAVLEVREAGQDLKISGGLGRAVQTPPRYGITAYRLAQPLNLEIQRLREGSGQGRVELVLYCEPKQAQQLWQWYGILQNLTALFTGGTGSLSNRFPSTELAAVETAAFDAESTALATHLRAQALLLAGRAADAAEAFARAAKAWDELGISSHASAARVGLAEDLNRSSQYQRVLELTRSRQNYPDGNHYYGARLENARCLALHYLGELEEAAQCYAWSSERFDKLDEALELASTGINFAAVERARGRTDSARKLLLDSAELAQGALSYNAQGRAQFGLSGLAQEQGDINEALLRLHLAQQHFAEGGERRWQAAILLRMASLLSELQALPDARAAAMQALSMLDTQHAPARVAAAQLLLARIEHSDQRIKQALQHADAALSAYTTLNMPDEIALVRLLRSSLLLQAGKADQAESELNEISPQWLTSPTSAARHTLLTAELLLQHGKPSKAKNKLQQLAEAISLKERLQHDHLLAEIAWQEGLIDKAHQLLQARAGELSALSGITANALLKHLINESVGQLRQTAIDLVGRELEGVKSNPQQLMERLLPWLSITTQRSQPLPGQTPSQQPSDKALTRWLLAHMISGSDKEQSAAVDFALLQRLAQRTTVTRETTDRKGLGAWALMPLAQPNKPLLVLLRGRHYLLKLWLETDATPRLSVLPAKTIDQHLQALRAHLSRPDSSLIDIDRQSRAMSALLFDDLHQPVPEQLRVLGNRLTIAIPWPLLQWPGQSLPLAENTSITLIYPFADHPQRSASAQRIDVLVAKQGGNILPDLASAASEPRLIAQHAAGRVVYTHQQASRKSALRALQQPGWLHLSTHGQTHAGRLMGSGLWLDPVSPGSNPQFLSWADVIEHGAERELVVLNACQLAESSPETISAALSFATAVSQAGVTDTIAAQWPVSDTASAVWVPVLYSILTNTDPPDPARALAEARRKLRVSRSFKHPFHWAGWVHLQRVNLPAADTYR